MTKESKDYKFLYYKIDFIICVWSINHDSVVFDTPTNTEVIFKKYF